MKIYFVIIILCGAFLSSCSPVDSVNDSNLGNDTDSIIIDAYQNQLPNDYFSGDGNISITFYDNGNLKDIVIVSDKYDLPYDTAALAAGFSTGGVMYVDQRISYNEDQTLKLVSINADTNATFWYSTDDGISKCYDCDSLYYSK